MDAVVVEWAAAEGARLLGDVGSRWAHCDAAGLRAREVSGMLASQEDREALISAAYVHDIGHAPELRVTGFHPIDGARYLRSMGLGRIACLVAHHTEARFEAELLGLMEELEEFPREVSATADALAYCDLTTGPSGEAFSFEERFADIGRRYADNEVVLEALRRARRSLAGAVVRTEARLKAEGVA